ncbi:hypothetical protein ACLOJK_025629 [Asimina triloba]
MQRLHYEWASRNPKQKVRRAVLSRLDLVQRSLSVVKEVPSDPPRRTHGSRPILNLQQKAPQVAGGFAVRDGRGLDDGFLSSVGGDRQHAVVMVFRHEDERPWTMRQDFFFVCQPCQIWWVFFGSGEMGFAVYGRLSVLWEMTEEHGLMWALLWWVFSSEEVGFSVGENEVMPDRGNNVWRAVLTPTWSAMGFLSDLKKRALAAVWLLDFRCQRAGIQCMVGGIVV